MNAIGPSWNGVRDVSNITAIARQFFEACEAGRGWERCQACCTRDASFAAQAEPLATVTADSDKDSDFASHLLL